MADKLRDLVFLGAEDNEKTLRYMLEDDPCFGRKYAKTASECDRCRAPVLLDGKVSLLNEVCKSVTEDDTTPVQIKKLTSKQVLDKVRSGLSPVEIIEHMTGGDPSYREVVEARGLLASRMAYLKHQKNLPVPDIPTIKEIWDGEEETGI
jgi:hypothetical protein